MKKHAASHGLAVLICSIASGLLVRMGDRYYPDIMRTFEGHTHRMLTILDLPYSPRSIATLVIAVGLAVIWGIAFYFMHSDRKPRPD